MVVGKYSVGYRTVVSAKRGGLTEEAKLDYGGEENDDDEWRGGVWKEERHSRLTLPQRGTGRRRSRGCYVDAGVRWLRVEVEAEVEG